MQNAMLLFLLIVSAVSALFILKKAFNPDKSLWPPGPPAWPVIGHLHLLGDLPHQSLCNLSKLYGPLMGLRLGGVPTIVVSSPDMAKEILQTHDLTFASRPHLAVGVHLYSNSTSMGLAPYGPYWKHLRQLFASELFSSKRLESFRHVREGEIRALTRTLLQKVQDEPHVPIELRESLLATSNNINCRMAMGKRITEISSAMNAESAKEDLASLVEEVLYLMGVFSVGDFIPWMAWLDPQGYVKRMKALGRRTNALMQAVIDERRECHKARPGGGGGGGEMSQNDLLDVLLHAASNENRIPITDDNIKAVMLDIFAGGADTSSVTVEWTLAELINHPKVMKKLQEELDEVVGKSRLVEEVDIPNLPYLGAVVKESMRLHPVAPLLVPHEASKECQILGYKIPRKTRAYVNTWAIGRDPTLWERPEDFWPERIQNKTLDLHGQNFQLLPFGAGRRKCPAHGVGLLNVHLMVAALIQGFAWTLVPHNTKESDSHMHLLDMSERFGLALLMAKSLCAFATPRLPLHLY